MGEMMKNDQARLYSAAWGVKRPTTKWKDESNRINSRKRSPGRKNACEYKKMKQEGEEIHRKELEIKWENSSVGRYLKDEGVDVSKLATMQWKEKLETFELISDSPRQEGS